MEWLQAQLVEDQAYANGAPGPAAPLVRHQIETLGQVRLPEHFRGPLATAEVCFLGPHVVLDPSEHPPAPDSPLKDYLAYYNQERPERRDPYGHYTAIMDGRPWIATELVHWAARKDVALAAVPSLIDQTLDLTWRLLAETPVKTLVLTGNDALQWVLPRLGRRFGKLTGITRLHGQSLGRFPLPGAPGRELSVIASFHWSPEMPLFVRKVPGLEGLKPGEAITRARAMVAEAINLCAESARC
ncbi:MAG TPA: hypothetical protein VNT75_11465 [Symbiobacteriaceae bacterium]|nr:hypothetical protein [Symbiobacteriaceae bacterium]